MDSLPLTHNKGQGKRKREGISVLSSRFSPVNYPFTLYISGYSPWTTADEVRELFPTAKEINFPKDRKGLYIAFYDDVIMVQKAYEKGQDLTLNDVRLVVDYAESTREEINRLGKNAEISMPKSTEKGIDFAMPVDVYGKNPVQCIHTFEQARLYPRFLENVHKANYDKPSPIQKYAIPIILAGRDLMCCAHTGAGKKAAFLLPVFTGMMVNGLIKSRFSESPEPQAIVVAPTRQLVQQIYTEACKFSESTLLRSVLVYDGTSVGDQLRRLEHGAHIVIGTPGRLVDFITKGKIKLNSIKYLILDEADQLLEMGFETEVRRIVEQLGMPGKDDRQTLMFSSKVPVEVQKLVQDFLKDYLFVTVGQLEVGIATGASPDAKQNSDQLDTDERTQLIEILSHIAQKQTLGLYIGGFQPSTTTEEIQLLFPTAKTIDFPIDKGYCFAFYDDATKALVAFEKAQQGLTLKKMPLKVNFTQRIQWQIKQWVTLSGMRNRKELFISGYSPATTADDLRALFPTADGIRFPSNNQRFCFATYTNAQTAQAAYEKGQGLTLDNRLLAVDYVNNTPDQVKKLLIDTATKPLSFSPWTCSDPDCATVNDPEQISCTKCSFPMESSELKDANDLPEDDQNAESKMNALNSAVYSITGKLCKQSMSHKPPSENIKDIPSLSSQEHDSSQVNRPSTSSPSKRRKLVARETYARNRTRRMNDKNRASRDKRASDRDSDIRDKSVEKDRSTMGKQRSDRDSAIREGSVDRDRSTRDKRRSDSDIRDMRVDRGSSTKEKKRSDSNIRDRSVDRGSSTKDKKRSDSDIRDRSVDRDSSTRDKKRSDRDSDIRDRSVDSGSSTTDKTRSEKDFDAMLRWEQHNFYGRSRIINLDLDTRDRLGDRDSGTRDRRNRDIIRSRSRDQDIIRSRSREHDIDVRSRNRERYMYVMRRSQERDLDARSRSRDHDIYARSRSRDRDIYTRSRSSDRDIGARSRSPDCDIDARSRSPDRDIDARSRSPDRSIDVRSRSRDRDIDARSRWVRAIDARSRSRDRVIARSRSRDQVIARGISQDRVIPRSRRREKDISKNKSRDRVIARSRSRDQVIDRRSRRDRVLARSRSRDQVIGRSRDQVIASRSRDRAIARSRSQDSIIARRRSRDQDIARSRSRDQDIAKSRSQDQDIVRSRSRERYLYGMRRSADRDIDSRSRDQDIARSRSRDRNCGARSRSRDQDIARSRSRDQDIARDRSRDRNYGARSRSRDQDIARSRSRERYMYGMRRSADRNIDARSRSQDQDIDIGHRAQDVVKNKFSLDSNIDIRQRAQDFGKRNSEDQNIDSMKRTQDEDIDSRSGSGEQDIHVKDRNRDHDIDSKSRTEDHDIHNMMKSQVSQQRGSMSSIHLHDVPWRSSSNSPPLHSPNPEIGNPQPGEIRIKNFKRSSPTEVVGFQIERALQGGIFVSYVVDNSLAANNGIVVGDQILQFCGINLQHASKESATKLMLSCYDTFELVLQFNPDMSQQIDSISSIHPHDIPWQSSSNSLPLLLPTPEIKQPFPGEIRITNFKRSSPTEYVGFEIERASQGGIFVSAVTQNSLAASNGIVVGDQILEFCGINLQRVSKELAKRLMLSCRDTFEMVLQFNADNSLRGCATTDRGLGQPSPGAMPSPQLDTAEAVRAPPLEAFCLTPHREFNLHPPEVIRPPPSETVRPPHSETFTPLSGTFKPPRPDSVMPPQPAAFGSTRSEEFRPLSHGALDSPKAEEVRLRQIEEFRLSRPEEVRFHQAAEFSSRPHHDEEFRPHQSEEFRHHDDEEFRHHHDEEFRRHQFEEFRRHHDEEFRHHHDEEFRRHQFEEFSSHHDEELRCHHDEEFRHHSDEEFRHRHDVGFRPHHDTEFRPHHDAEFRHHHDAEFRLPQAAEFRPDHAEKFRPLQHDTYRPQSPEEIRPYKAEAFRQSPFKGRMLLQTRALPSPQDTAAGDTKQCDLCLSDP